MTFHYSKIVRPHGRFSIWGLCYLLLFLLINTSQLNAEPAFQFHTLDKQEGLASSVVYDIAEDKDGFIWFATEDGLQKYDGFEFVSYRHQGSNQKSISSNIVRKLLIDNYGRLWVGTDNGLDLFRQEYDDFLRISSLDYTEKKTNNYRVRALFQSEDNTIWAGTTKGLTAINPDSFDVQEFDHAKIRSIFEDDHKQLWVGTLGEGLYRFDRTNNSFIANNKVVTKSGEPDLSIDLSKNLIMDIFRDSFGRVLIATWGKGVLLLNKKSHTLTRYNIKLPSDRVRTIHQDEEGRIWFGTQEGILIQNTIENEIIVISSKNENSDSRKIDNVIEIFQSKDETVWIGSQGGGVGRHFPSSRKFESFGTHKQGRLGLVDPAVFALSEGVNGKVWIGTESGKLAEFDPITKRFIPHRLILNGKLFAGSIFDTFPLSDEIILLGTDLGLLKYGIKSNSLEIYRDKMGEPIKGQDAVKLIKKDPYGRLWIMFFHNGLQGFEISEKNVISPIDTYDLDIVTPQAVMFSKKDELIVGTEGDGISKVFFTENGISKSVLKGSEGTNVLWIERDWNGLLWVGTASQGIKVFFEDGRVLNLGEEEGLPNNTVYSIIADRASQRVWATTNVGMVSINPKTFDIERYGFYDGLQGDEFNRAGLITKKGYIYFGGLNGFSRFFPNIIKTKLYLQEPKITGLSIANEEVKVSVIGNSLLERSLLVSKEINLQFGQTPFSIEFTSPQFVKPKDIEFRYRLSGLDDKWIVAAKGSRRATYTNIDHGEYVFELQVRDINSNWDSIVERKNIVVHPPWWLTSFAKIAYFLVIALILTTFVYLNWRRHQAVLLTQKTVEESEKRLKLSLWGGGNEIWDWNLVSGEVLRSDADKNININCSILSRNLKELSNYIHQYDVERVRRGLSSHLNGETDFFDAAYRIKDLKLGWRWIQDRAKVVERDENNAPTRMSGTQRDVSEIHRKDAEIERLGQAFRTTSDGVWIRDEKWRLIECNPSYEKITGFTFTEKKGEELWFPDVAEQQANIIQRIRLSLMEKGNWQGEVWAERKESDPFPQKLTIDTILDEKGYVRYYVGVFSDITFHKRAEEEFRKLANFDSLTGLPNRACLYDRLNQTINKTKIRKERFAILVIDIDNFKRVNDSLGHSVGDTLISEVAKRLTHCNREEDTIARVGGDEFVIIRDGIRSSTEVASFAESMLKELNMPVFIKGQKLNLNFSIGITLSPEDGLTADKLLRNADTAMYEAKKEVLNSYHFYSVELNQRARKKLALENALRNAIEEDSIDLAYQPKVDMKTGRVCGMEALARWKHPIFGFVSPEEFISLAEETGLILSLGHQLLRKAIVQTKCWVDEGIMRGRMCVNLSAHQFWHRDLASEVSAILKEVELDAKYLELELTESACIQELDQTVKQMLALRKLGIHLALDDFGTGYSSLAQLKTLPLDTLKVDKSFIQNIQNSVKDANIVRAIIDIANSLELGVVIEGVETKQQCDYLWQSRASIIQGFFFSKPVNYTAMAKLLDKTWKQSSYLSNTAHNVTNLGL